MYRRSSHSRHWNGWYCDCRLLCLDNLSWCPKGACVLSVKWWWACWSLLWTTTVLKWVGGSPLVWWSVTLSVIVNPQAEVQQLMDKFCGILPSNYSTEVQICPSSPVHHPVLSFHYANPSPISFTHLLLSLPSCHSFTCTRSPAINTVSLACNTILSSDLGAFGDLCGECKLTYRHPLSNMLIWMTMLFCRTTPIKSVRSLTSVTPPLLISKWVCSCDWALLQWLCLNHWL